MTYTERNTKSDSPLTALFRELVSAHSGETKTQLEALLVKLQFIEVEFANNAVERQRQLKTLIQDTWNSLPSKARQSPELAKFAAGVQSMISKDHDDARQRELGRASKVPSKRPTFRHSE